MNSDKYFVVCYNHDEFNFFVKKKIEECWKVGNTSVSMSNFIYVDGASKIKGHRNPRGWFCGRWSQREDIEHIIMSLLTAHDGSHNVLSSMLTLVREIQKT